MLTNCTNSPVPYNKYNWCFSYKWQWTFLLRFQNKKLPSDVKTDSGEVSDDDDEQEDNLVMNGDCKLERQNSKQGSIKRQIGKVGSYLKSLLSLQERSCF